MPVAQAPSWVTLVRAGNPGPMTLDGTNSWVLRAPGAAGCVIVDPGPADAGHLAALAGHGPVEAIIVTHGHLDHTAGVDDLITAIGDRTPVFAVDRRWSRHAEPVADGDRYDLAGLSLTAWATPGHTADSVCLVVADPAGETAVFTGDTILGRGTAVVAWPDGDLGDYLTSLDRLRSLDGIPVLPGHGPILADCAVIAAGYRSHRDDRLIQVRAAVDAGAGTPAEVVSAVYPDLNPTLIPAAEWTVRAALAYLGYVT